MRTIVEVSGVVPAAPAATGQWWGVLLANRFFRGFRGSAEEGFRALLAEIGGGGTGRNG
ncbi:hypothetical protein F9C11_19980 [Amycolatopsis sp. VS8301801F10]|uniref:hypothetical protein n=1 Tax=Amycolatopsis sp. VS8301801F10 TaxID=2652442 RepID=UPI0038FCADED